MTRRSGRDVRVRLLKPLERSVHAGHPWLYREALESFDTEPGTVVTVLGKSGRFLARGLADAGPIAVRVFTTRDEPVDAPLFARRIDQAFALRARVVPDDTDAYRLLHGEGDRLPGVVCDRYGAFAVLQLDGDAAAALEAEFVAVLRAPLAQLGVHSLLVRTGRKQTRSVRCAYGEQAPAELIVRERGMRLALSLEHGQKTGLFLDHRESRARVRTLARGLRVLNLYGYTGGFSVAAGLGGAEHVTTIDSAAAALEHAERSFAHNQLDPARHRTHAADVPALLASLASERERYGLIVADPPNFAPNAAAKAAALASYAALHAAALSILEPDGYYLAASCSSHIALEDFAQSLREGARRARRSLQMLERWSAPADHPRLLAFPEGDYLKVSLLRG